MSASIRGHQTRFKITENDGETGIVDVTGFDVNQDSNFIKTFYVGRAIPEGDQTIEGWSGSFDTEVKNAAVDEFIDGLVTNNLNGIGVSDYVFLDTELYADGTSKTYAYFDMQFKISKTTRGLNEKVTKRLEFQAAGRIAV